VLGADEPGDHRSIMVPTRITIFYAPISTALKTRRAATSLWQRNCVRCAKSVLGFSKPNVDSAKTQWSAEVRPLGGALPAEVFRLFCAFKRREIPHFIGIPEKRSYSAIVLAAEVVAG